MRPLLFALSLLFVVSAFGQDPLFQSLHDNYEQFQEPSLTDRRFKHEDIVSLIQQLGDPFRVKVEGQSVEGRDIYRITAGNGPTTVLLWSQMHGDEPTATAALFDIFRFLSDDNAAFRSAREQILSDLTLVFIPMLNPDGAELFQRRNALGIDLNRDALRLTSPEAQLLKRVRDETDADWGFNLHDQSRYYGAGYPTEQMATLSFLAPAYNFEKEVNTGRERAMQLIAQLNAGLQSFAPGQIARYSDAFEPRAFGDNMQRWGTSTILIESGGNWEDREKQDIRQLNFVSLLRSFVSIAKGGYTSFSRADYNKIPYNRGGVFKDLLLRELTFQRDGKSYLLDIAFNTSERDYRGHRNFYFRGRIEDVGDLSYHRAYEELPPSQLTVEVGYRYPELVENMNALRGMDPQSLLNEGYVVVRLRRTGPPWERDSIPFHITGADSAFDEIIAPGENPPLLLRDAGGTVRYVVVNGQLFNAQTFQW